MAAVQGEQRSFDFTAAATESRRAELESLLAGLGLTRAEIGIIVHVWQDGTLRDNRSALMVSRSILAQATGYSVRWIQDSLTNLIAFGILSDAAHGPGRPKSYLIDWAVLRSLEPVRAVGEIDPFAAFDCATPPEHATSEVTSAPTSAVTSEVTSAPTSAPTSAVTSAQHHFTESTLNPLSLTSPSMKANPSGSASGDSAGWGRWVEPRELDDWESRYRLFRRACEIQPAIDPVDPDDRIGFVAACMCASETGHSPPVLLLHFVRIHAWRHRGRGGLDGHWIGQAMTAIRERDKRIPPAKGVAGNVSESTGRDGPQPVDSIGAILQEVHQCSPS